MNIDPDIYATSARLATDARCHRAIAVAIQAERNSRTDRELYLEVVSQRNAALARAEAAEKRCAELEELRRQDEAHGHWCVATARERDDALKRCAELEARVTYWQEAEAALLREYGEMADRLLCDKHDAEKRYRMERHDHLEASESYVKAANERAWWEGRAVEAEKTLDEFARTYADAVSRYEAAEKRCAELEAMYECVYCEHTARGETERDEALKRCEELEAERDQWMRRFSRSAAEGIRALEERDEAQRVARVLAEFASTHTHGAGSERDLAIRAALAYPEQKPEPREPSDDLVTL